MKPDWPLSDRPAACAIAHQYSTVTVFTLPFYSLKEVVGALILLVYSLTPQKFVRV